MCLYVDETATLFTEEPYNDTFLNSTDVYGGEFNKASVLSSVIQH